MALSKKGKKFLFIGSITLGAFFFLFIIFLLFNSFRISSAKKAYPTTLEYDYMESSGSFGDSGLIKDSFTQNAPQRDFANYEDTTEESKVRKNGTVNLEVKKLDSAMTELDEITNRYNGSITNSYESGEGNSRRATVTVKVYTRYFEDIYKDFKSMDGNVIYASYSMDDVTREYTDLESRLKNLEAKEEQLVKIMDTAETVEDTLSVYNQLSSTRSEIEVIKGQIKYLDGQVDYAYITVNFSISDTGQIVPDDRWEPLGVFKNAFSALIDFGTSLVDMLIWVLVFSPLFLIPLVIILYIVKKKAKKKK